MLIFTNILIGKRFPSIRFFSAFAAAIFIIPACHDFADHPAKTDDDISGDQEILNISVDANYNIELELDREYSGKCEIILERRAGSGIYMPVTFRRQGLSLIIDSSIDKESDKLYTYRFHIRKNDFTTGLSNELSYNYISQILYPPESLLINSVENLGIELRWTDKSRVEEGYRIERDTGVGFALIATLSFDQEYYFDQGIPVQPANPLTLNYRITAFKGSRQSPLVIQPFYYSGLGSPTGLHVQDSTIYGCLILWNDNSLEESGYAVERRMGQGNFAEIGTVAAGVTSYRDTLSEKGEYWYRVRALAPGRYSGYSNAVRFIIPANTFTDPRDGRIYNYVTIGSQVWMATNLDYDTLNGTGSAYYQNSAGNKKFGRYYTWALAKQVAPPGWHLPSKAEWQLLIDYLSASGANPYYAMMPGGSTGFNLQHYGLGPGWAYLGYDAYYWSSDASAGDLAWCFGSWVGYNNVFIYDNWGKGALLNVRCIKD